MHRLIRDHLEQVLAESAPRMGGSLASEHNPHETHLCSCEECRSEVAAMREQAALLRDLKAPDTDLEPRPGFYARVMQRIETEGAGSIWNIFFESPFGRRIAAASMALAVLLGLYLITSERFTEARLQGEPAAQSIAGEDQPGMVLTVQGAPDRDSVLVNLVTYQDQ
jgi:hypothetical protein